MDNPQPVTDPYDCFHKKMIYLLDIAKLICYITAAFFMINYSFFQPDSVNFLPLHGLRATILLFQLFSLLQFFLRMHSQRILILPLPLQVPVCGWLWEMGTTSLANHPVKTAMSILILYRF